MSKRNTNTVEWTKANTHEALATLYLRLNGYFTTGLIVPSPKKSRNRGEVDCLAIRHPHHSQRERGVEPSKFLIVPTERIDLIVCEVKSSVERLQFNASLSQTLPAVLRWAGTFNEQQVPSVAARLKVRLPPGVTQTVKTQLTVR